MPTQTNDTRYMQQALELASRGIALASPNPRVGAVLVSAEGKVVGRGTHTYDGIKHAEVLAIEAAGHRTQGTTLYLNLEPCSHVGRTGPCADAIIAALGGLLFGFDTVVISGATSTLSEVYKLSPMLLGFTVASALLGTVLGSMFAA